MASTPKPKIISDDDAEYYTRAWRRSAGNVSPETKAALFAWVRAQPPSRLLSVLGRHLSAEELTTLMTEAGQ